MKATRPFALLLCLAGMGSLLAATLASAAPPPPPPVAGAEAAAPDEGAPRQTPAPHALPGEEQEPDGPGRRFREHRHGPDGMPIQHLLRGLDLSPQQRDSIHALMEKNREPHRALVTRRFELQRAFTELDPVAADYRKKADGLAADAAKLAQETLRFDARMTSEVVAQLSPEQRQQLQTRQSERRARQAERLKRRCEADAHS